jgi:hypothetical protein
MAPYAEPAALRNASSRLSTWPIWFQLANVWLTKWVLPNAGVASHLFGVIPNVVRPHPNQAAGVDWLTTRPSLIHLAAVDLDTPHA